MRQPVLFPLIFFNLLIASISCDTQRTFQKTETIMGTEVTITVSAPSAGEGAAAIEAAMFELRRLDRMMSLYKEDSEITRVNLAAGKHPVRVSAEMTEVVEQSLEISRLTRGVFDITIGPLVVLWQMRLKEGKTPTDLEISGVRGRIGFKNITLDKKASTIYLKKKGMIMDLGGVAKGYAADRAAHVLIQRGVKNGIVAVAGDIRAIGQRPDGSPWRIGVQHPREPENTLTVLELSDVSVSTSGDYERFKIIGNKRYHHILDPRTGRPSTGMESVTVTGARGAVVDPLTTALFILGPEKGIQLVQSLGCEAVFVDDKGRVTSTPKIRAGMIGAGSGDRK